MNKGTCVITNKEIGRVRGGSHFNRQSLTCEMSKIKLEISVVPIKSFPVR